MSRVDAAVQHSFRTASSLGLAVLLAAACSLPALLAHEGQTPIHYVAPGGRDDSDCADRTRPCLTIPYALTRAEKGDEVRVAGGFFDFEPQDPAEVIQLLNRIVPVRGSFDATEFVTQDVFESPTILRGPHASYAPALEQRGLLLGPAATSLHAATTQPLGGVTRYVSSDGRSTGDCGLDAPCALDFALSIAQSDDTLLIAGGDYDVPPGAAEVLVRPDITVLGGYLESQAFAAAAPSVRPTYVTGPSFEQREALAERGLTLVQDHKVFAISDVIDAGLSSRAADVRRFTPCDAAARMAGPFPCDGIDLLAHVPLGAFSGRPQAGNDIWGFVDLRDDREYALMGLLNGTAVIEVTDPFNPREVGTIPGHEAPWRDIKVYQVRNESGDWQAYAYVTADKTPEPQGLQIIDLSGLPDSISLAATYGDISRAHNIYISNVDYSTGATLPGMEAFAFVLGADKNLGAALALSLRNPVAPVEVMTPVPGTQYAHDAVSTVIDDSRAVACRSGGAAPSGGHRPCEVLADFNESTLDLWDVTDKSAPLLLSSTTYPDSAYTHSGWWSQDTRFLFVQDELDEKQNGLNTTLRTFEIGDLTNPVLTGVWEGPATNTDHNGFAVGDRYYMSAYRRGLMVLDIANPSVPTEVAFFDTFPSPADNTPDFNGAWGVYPFLPSGTLLVSSIEDGLFVLRASATAVTPPIAGGDLTTTARILVLVCIAGLVSLFSLAVAHRFRYRRVVSTPRGRQVVDASDRASPPSRDPVPHPSPPHGTDVVGVLLAPDGSARFTLLRERLCSQEGVLIGRDANACDMALRSPTVSRLHLRLRFSDGILLAEDLDSLDGTYLDGVLLKPFEPRAVASGRILDIAGHRLHVRLEPYGARTY